jgi:hypothetical protein
MVPFTNYFIAGKEISIPSPCGDDGACLNVRVSLKDSMSEALIWSNHSLSLGVLGISPAQPCAGPPDTQTQSRVVPDLPFCKNFLGLPQLDPHGLGRYIAVIWLGDKCLAICD